MYKSYLNNESLSRGLQNNNPGNLVQTNIAWVGKIPLQNNTDARFEQFIELRYGLRALMRDIMTDLAKGKTTVSLLISEFAPAFENNTASYIAYVSKILGIDKDTAITKLNKEILIGLTKGIVYIENGSSITKYITNEDYEQAITILGKSYNINLPIAEKKRKFDNPNTRIHINSIDNCKAIKK